MAYNSVSLLLNLLYVLVASASIVDDVCQQTHDQALCTRVLGSDPRTPHASVQELEEIAIYLASNSANLTRQKIHNLNLSAKDPHLKRRLSMCDECYGVAIEALKDAPNNLKEGRYMDVNIAAGAVCNYAVYCENAFKIPPAITSPLTDENNHMQNLTEIIAIISNKLDLMYPPSPSAGTAIDESIAYNLMLLALVLGFINL